MQKSIFIIFVSICLLAGSVFYRFYGRQKITVEGRILGREKVDAYTSNKMAMWNTQAMTVKTHEGEAQSTTEAINIVIKSRLQVQMNAAQSESLGQTVNECALYLKQPTWARYRQLKEQGPFEITFGAISTAFEQHWLKTAPPASTKEARVHRLWSFVNENKERQPPPIVKAFLNDSLNVTVLETGDPELEVFNAVRQQYDGLMVRALSDVILQKKSTATKTHTVAVASGICVTGFNDTRAPIAFALEWLVDEGTWWPISLSCSHPAYVPVF